MKRASFLSLAALALVMGSFDLCVAAAAEKRAPLREAENAVLNLEVADGCEATLFSSEPDISNITTLDVDHLGRVWAGEVKNYRKLKHSRPEGDRILVLEDTDRDGVCDKQTVFYQGRDIDSVHGICVLGDRVIVSAGDTVINLYDDNGDLRCDRKEVMFTGIGGTQHDHGIHAFVFGPDGKLYFNFGNSGKQIKDKDGKPIIDVAGNEVKANRQPYQEGMVFRCNLDGSHFETLGWNFRNNWEVAIDSYGTLWQSDNDDDGNKGVRINFVMEFGNYGYKDEFTGAGWTQNRTDIEKDIPSRHWHLNDPGVVPNLLHTGQGSPTGICVYEGSLLPKMVHGQIIHCDAGPSVCRMYAVRPSGAGYEVTETVNVLHGARDNWFRPADVCVAPDGSLFVGDWYDPGVGGHNQQEVNKGRIFRIAPPGVKYDVSQLDFTTPQGAAEAMKSPNASVRFMAWKALETMGDEGRRAVWSQLWEKAADPRDMARAVWFCGKTAKNGQTYVDEAIGFDQDPNIRIVGLRLARQLSSAAALDAVRTLVNDKDPAVRRECAIALRHATSPEAAELWSQLALQHDGKDRWYLEALGIAADGQWDAYLDSYLEAAGDAAKTTAGKDIIWRSRGKRTPELLVDAIKASESKEHLRFMRAFDFQTEGPEKAKALTRLTQEEIDPVPDSVVIEAIERLDTFNLDASSRTKAAVLRYLAANRGSAQFFALIERLEIRETMSDLLELAIAQPGNTSGVTAAKLFLKLGSSDAIEEILNGADTARAAALVTALGNAGGKAASDRLTRLVTSDSHPLAVRAAAARAIGKSKPGTAYLLGLAKAKTLPADLTFTVTNILFTSPMPSVVEEAKKVLSLPATADAAPLPPLSKLVKMPGNAERGKKLFATTATCANCHVVHGEGKEVGPNLSEIGSKLGREAILVSILDPSAGISHNYETYVAATNDGKVVSGLLMSKTDTEVVLKDATAIVHTLPADEVDEFVKLPTSLMPADLQKLLTAQELVDVVEYMMTLKKKE
jgi:putative membrane-bound dehydrogenase-like protein